MRYEFDFKVPEIYGGMRFELPHVDGLENGTIKLEIPEETVYISIMTVEHNEEAGGNQDKTKSQKILYYDGKERLLNMQNLDDITATSGLVKRMMAAFEKLPQH